MGSKKKQTQSQTTTNTVTDTSANAGATGAIALGSSASLRTDTNINEGLQVAEGARVSIETSDPETIQTAFQFGVKALDTVSQNTQRQVDGAVDAARQASLAASRLADSPAETGTTPASVLTLETLKPYALPILGGLVVLGGLLIALVRSLRK